MRLDSPILSNTGHGIQAVLLSSCITTPRDPINLGLPDMWADPVIQLLSAARSVVAISLMPSRERLLLQLERKNLGGATLVETRALARRALIREALMALSTKLRLLASTQEGGPLRQRMRLYRRPGWLEQTSNQWNQILDSLAAEGRLSKKLVLVPMGDVYADQTHEWVVEPGAQRAPELHAEASAQK